MFDMFKLCVFSAIKGVVLERGQPVPGARVVRGYGPPDDPVIDETVTNERGEFHLPTIYRTSLFAALFPHEPVIRQNVTIQHGGREYPAWFAYKRDYDENTETDGKPAEVVCRLEAEPQRRGKIFGICELR